MFCVIIRQHGAGDYRTIGEFNTLIEAQRYMTQKRGEYKKFNMDGKFSVTLCVTIVEEEWVTGEFKATLISYSRS